MIPVCFLLVYNKFPSGVIITKLDPTTLRMRNSKDNILICASRVAERVLALYIVFPHILRKAVDDLASDTILIIIVDKPIINPRQNIELDVIRGGSVFAAVNAAVLRVERELFACLYVLPRETNCAGHGKRCYIIIVELQHDGEFA